MALVGLAAPSRNNRRDLVTLALAFVPGVTLTKWTRLWEERRPDVDLGFVATTEATQVDALLDGTADVAFVRLPLPESALVGLSVIRLYSEVAVAVLPEDHPLADQDSVTLADLADITLHGNQGSLRDAVELIAAGVGALVVPHALARQNSRKDVVSRDVTDADETWIAVAWVTENETADIEEFVGIVRGRSANSSRGGSIAPAKEKIDPDLQIAKEKPERKAPVKPRGKYVHRSTARPQGKRRRQGR
jgi:DNA-binding transcriptional LysR family regulator